MSRDQPLSCSLQMGWMDSVIKHTSVWHNFLKVSDKVLHTNRRNHAYGESHAVYFTILHTERTGVIQPFISVLANQASFPRVTKGCCRSLHDPLRSCHVIRQDHVVVSTQSWRNQTFYQSIALGRNASLFGWLILNRSVSWHLPRVFVL